MDPRVFDEIRGIVYENSGIRLPDGKETMMSARIAGRLRSLKLDDEGAYLGYLKQDLDREIVELLNVISTNVTHFFREQEHFDHLTEVVREWLAHGQRRFRFWSAACSTGEEPYSLAMMFRDIVDSERLSVEVRILATDISTRVLEGAQASVYGADKVEQVPERMRKLYFDEHDGVGGAEFEFKASLREMVLFKRLNLAKPPFPMGGPFDVILCRNVMIYFDESVRDALIKECCRLLRPGGYLIVGKSESLLRSSKSLMRAGPSIYRWVG